MQISYAIPVCNEYKEIEYLLNYLIKHVREGDEIIVQCDEGNTTLEVYKVLNKCADRVKIIEYPLNNDFASFKNNLKDNCEGDYIFQIDADEYPEEYLMSHIDWVIDNNPDVDLFWVPRINKVNGLTQEHITKWGWRVDPDGRINFPDYQCRILKNTKEIKWKNKVHEILTGYKTESHLPANDEFCIHHLKDIGRQESQNELYSSITENKSTKRDTPVDDINFWKKRINNAPPIGHKRCFQSVFNTSDENWEGDLKEHLKIIDKHIDTKNDKVLDAGCGYGRMSKYFDNYIGVDFSPDFIDMAKHKYGDKEFIIGDLKDLPFEDKQFEWSFCISIKRMVVDCNGKREWEKMLGELKRVSKKVLLLEYTDPIDDPTFSNVYEIIEEKDNSFLISGYGRSGTKFLSNLMNTSPTWEVLHEPLGYFDYDSYKNNNNIPNKISSRFKKDNYGEVNSMLCDWFLNVKVNKRGLIFRNPKDIFLSIANRKTPDNFLNYSIDLLQTYQTFDKYIEDYGSTIQIIRFDKMVSDVKYCQNILNDFGIIDVKITEDILNKKSNSSLKYTYTNMNSFNNEIKENVRKATEIYKKINQYERDKK